MQLQKIKRLLLGLSVICLMGLPKVYSVSLTRVGDIEIYNNGHEWKCDKIFCPIETTHRCFVSKEKSSDDPTIVIRENICYDIQNNVVAHHRVEEQSNANHNVNVKINSGRDGSTSSYSSQNSNVIYNGSNIGTLSPEDAERINAEVQNRLRETEHHLREVQNSIRNNIETQMANLHYQMNSLRNQFG